MGYAVEIPEEPADRTVVLDRDAIAWQRRVDGQVNVWHAAGSFPCSWALLLIDRGPLTPLVTDDDCDTPDWQAAGFTGPDLERYAQPEGVERVDAPGLENETAPTTELTNAQRDSLLATYGQALDYRDHDRRIDRLKPTGPIAGACATTWQLTDDPDGGVTSRVTRAYPGGDDEG